MSSKRQRKVNRGVLYLSTICLPEPDTDLDRLDTCQIMPWPRPSPSTRLESISVTSKQNVLPAADRPNRWGIRSRGAHAPARTSPALQRPVWQAATGSSSEGARILMSVFRNGLPLAMNRTIGPKLPKGHTSCAPPWAGDLLDGAHQGYQLCLRERHR